MSFTKGPGLIGSLLVGTSFAKSLSLALNIPLIEVNHMQAHILAHFIQTENKPKDIPSFPFICLTVSGGHTQLVRVNDYFTYELLGETIDDAAGEAFDKGAKILGLPYPGGPLIDKYASQGDPSVFHFAKPRVQDLDFSFSGLKTSLLYFIRDKTKTDDSFIEKNISDICASYQRTIIDILLHKLKSATELTGIKQVALAGGVSANSGLRKALTELGQLEKWKVFIPDFQFCTDNAAMIAAAGYFKFQRGEFTTLDSVPAARWHIQMNK